MTSFVRRSLQVSASIACGTLIISFAKPHYDKKYNYPLHSFSEFSEFLDRHKDQKVAIIIGGGVVGTCNAFELHKKGYKTAIIEAKGNVAQECSNATWGGMSSHYSSVDYAKIFHRNMPQCTTYNNFNPIYINWSKLLLDLHFLRWGICFLLHRNWIVNKYKEWNIFNNDIVITEQNTNNQMETYVKNGIEYQINFIKHNEYIPDLKKQCLLNENGFVIIIRNNNDKRCKALDAMDAFKNGIYELNDMHDTVIYDCTKYSLEDIGERIGDKSLLTNLPDTDTIKYVEYSVNGYLADAPKFCNALKDYLTQNKALQFFGNTKVLDFDIDNTTNRIQKIYTNNGIMNLEKSNSNVIVVLCTGSWTPILCRKLNLFVPVYPLKGYNFIIDYKTAMIDSMEYTQNIPKHAMIDNFVFYVNYGTMSDITNRIRMASIGGIDGWNTECNDDIKVALYTQSKQMMHKVMNIVDGKHSHHDIKCVVGLRPLTYDTSVIVGKIEAYENLYIDVGPGYNGFKTAMASAHLLGRAADNESNYFAPHKHNIKTATIFCKIADLLASNS